MIVWWWKSCLSCWVSRMKKICCWKLFCIVWICVIMKCWVLWLVIFRVKVCWVKCSLVLVGGLMIRKMVWNVRWFNWCSLVCWVVLLVCWLIVVVFCYIFVMNIFVVFCVRWLVVGWKWVKYWWTLICWVRWWKIFVLIMCVIILLLNWIKVWGWYVIY